MIKLWYEMIGKFYTIRLNLIINEENNMQDY